MRGQSMAAAGSANDLQEDQWCGVECKKDRHDVEYVKDFRPVKPGQAIKEGNRRRGVKGQRKDRVGCNNTLRIGVGDQRHDQRECNGNCSMRRQRKFLWRRVLRLYVEKARHYNREGRRQVCDFQWNIKHLAY